MPLDPHTPILVGVGQHLHRADDTSDLVESLDLMQRGLEAAAQDCGAPELLKQADSVRVIKPLWRYGDPARVLAERFGCRDGVQTVGTPLGGNYVQACINDAASEIAAGREDVVLIAGGENGRSYAMARRAGIELSLTEAPGDPDRMLDEQGEYGHEAEIACGLRMPTQFYAIFESALRASLRETLVENKKNTSELWASLNRVARDNPNAWLREPLTADQIGNVADDNPMISQPYPRRMNANSRVDMGAGLIMCSVATAKASGIPESKWVYIHAGTNAKDHPSASRHWELDRSPAIRIAGRRALDLAGLSIEDIDYLDVYSCFPSAVRIASRELGVPPGRTLSVTGGLTFGGGPLNAYVMHSVARMVECLRSDPGKHGFITANGGMLEKHAFGVYSTEAPKDGFHFENVQKEVDAEPMREVVVGWKGSSTIEAYTVSYEGGAPSVGIAACRTPDGARTWARTESPSVLREMESGEFCGRAVSLDGSANFEIV